jgi:NADH:ubiquinone oxidoreductase subunit 6 (subunit J)
VVCAVLAILLNDLLKSALALAGASVFLAMLFFEMGAMVAGVFEISVVGGLITVLFIATISLISSEGAPRENRLVRWLFPVFFALLAAAVFFVMRPLSGQLPSLPGAVEAGAFGPVFWGGRTFDLVGQIGVILAGVLCVLALFRKRSGDE